LGLLTIGEDLVLLACVVKRAFFLLTTLKVSLEESSIVLLDVISVVYWCDVALEQGRGGGGGGGE